MVSCCGHAVNSSVALRRKAAIPSFLARCIGRLLVEKVIFWESAASTEHPRQIKRCNGGQMRFPRPRGNLLFPEPANRFTGQIYPNTLNLGVELQGMFAHFSPIPRLFITPEW